MPYGSDLTNVSLETKSPKKLERKGRDLCVRVSEGEEKFRESNYSDIKKVLKEDILCSTCGENLKPNVKTGREIFYHPHLMVLMCQRCRTIYKDGKLSSDEDGMDKYCRWCAQGGSLYCCSKCVCTFCKKCIRKNFGRDLLKTIKETDWQCFLCQPEPLYKCRAVCYAAVQCSRNKRREKFESQKSKISELAERKRLGTKPKRMSPKRKRKSESTDSEDVTINELVEVPLKKKSDANEKPQPKHKTTEALKATRHVLTRESSEDFTDSDFEPKNSQRLKPCIKRSRHLKEAGNSRSMDQAGPSQVKEDETSSPVPLTPKQQWVVLDSNAEDVARASALLNDQIASFRKRYLEQSWEQYMLPVAANNLQKYVRRAMTALSDASENLSILVNDPLKGSHSSKHIGNHSETEVPLQEEDNIKQEEVKFKSRDNRDDTKVESSHRRASNEKTSEENCNSEHIDLPQRCGSIESINSGDDASPKIQRCGSTESESGPNVGSPKTEGDPSNSEAPETPLETDEVTNAVNWDFDVNLDGSCDIFADDDFPDNQSSHSNSEVATSETRLSRCLSPEKSSPGAVIQSEKSLACKANLMDSSSSESDSEEKEVKTKGHETDSNSDSDSQTIKTIKSSNFKKASFSIKDLSVYKSDIKLRGECSVKVNRLDELEEKKHLELVGDYYDASSCADSDSDNSINKLTNLNSLKRTGIVSDSNSEKSSKVSNGLSGKRKKILKKKPKEQDKLADFLNTSNADGSGVESSTENACSEMGKETAPHSLPGQSLNEMNKKLLLQSSDSECDDSDTKTKECANDEKKVKIKEEVKEDVKEDVKEEVKESVKEEQSEPSGDPVEPDNLEAESKCSTGQKSDSETDPVEKKKDWRKDKLLTGKLSDTDTSDDDKKWQKKKAQVKNKSDSSDSDQVHVVKRKSQGTPKKKADSDVDSSTSEDFVTKKKRKAPAKKSSSSSSSESEKTKARKKRRRIKMPNSDSSEDEDKKDKEDDSPNKGRKKIRHVIREDDLEEGTKEAAKEEEERLRRIAERQKMYEEVYDTVQKGFDVLEKLVLDFDEKTKEPLVEVDRALVKKLKPHQGKGIKFMWDACFESLKRIETSKGSGCILAHCMGLGKTFQVVTLVHTLFKFPDTKVNRVLVVCPVSTVLNWVSEFHKWLHDLKDGPDIETFEMTRCKQNPERSYRLREWMESGGVMVIGYDMYRNLTNPKLKRIRAGVMKTFQTALVDPGPDLVICDEGHLLKNEDTGISKAMTRVKTLRRVILTGTPLQNNLKEYHCMVQFVKPNLLGTRKEFLNRFVNPITNGQFEDSTSHDVKRMKRRAHVLHKTLEGCVQRFDYSVLTPFLPSKEEYVISVRLTELQEKLYRHYLEHFSSKGYQGKGAQLFADFQQLQRIWTHPRVLKMSQERNELKAEKEDEDSEGSLKDFIDDDSDESDSNESSSPQSSSDDVVCLSDGSHTDKKKPKAAPKTARRTRSNKDVPSDPEPPPEPSKRGGEWWESYLEGNELEDLRASSKLVLLFSILKDCEENGEKLLVFSQSLFSLDVIEYFLGKIDDATQKGVQEESLNGHQGSWSLGIDYFRLDGSTPTDTRSIWCNLFNKSSNLKGRLFLISTRAGGLGINLVAANRVIIFDASWNPSHDVQSIFRVYRFGQKRPCFIYRFLAQGTMEEKIYERQVTKLSLACRVVDELQIERYYKMADLQELYNFTPADRNTQELPKLPKDHLFAEILKAHGTLITTYHEHDSLLENKESEELNEDERKAAWEDYENEKKGPINQGGQFGLAEHLPTMEQLITLLKLKHPDKTDQEITESAAHAYRQMMQQQQIQQQQLQQQQLHQQKLMQQYYLQQQQQQLRMQQHGQFPLQQPHQTFQQQQFNNTLLNQYNPQRMQQPMPYQYARNLNSQLSALPSTSMPSHSRQVMGQQPAPQQWQTFPGTFSQAHKEP